MFAALLAFGSNGAWAQGFSLTLLPTTLPAATQGTAYNQTITAVGGTEPYDYAVTAGALPPGLSLHPVTGAITGTPGTPGTYNFTVTAEDVDMNSGFRSYSFQIGTPGLLSISPSTLPSGTQGTAYSQSVSASGGVGGYVYSISAGALPTGLALNPSTGAITGTPSAGGLFNFTVFARDSNGNTGTQAYAVNIGSNSLTVNPASLPNGSQTVAYSQTVSATGGTGPYTFSVSVGSLPAGLALDANTGVISGTPTGSGASSFTIRALDSLGNFGIRAYTITIGTASLTVNPGSLPNGSQTVAYSQTVSATGGTGPYTFAVTSGALPAGLTLNTSSGLISGTPTGSGASSFTIRATDSLGNIGSQAYSVTIGTSSLTVNPSSLPNGTQSVAYSQTVSATGGTSPYTFAVISGSLPSGLTLNTSSGAITGTPTGSGASSFTIRATDSLGNIGSRAYSVTIGTSSLTVNPSSLPNGTQSTAYSQTVSATGGTGPYTFVVISGALPTGLTLNTSSGLISGTPTGSGAASFSIQATDTLGNIGARAYSVNIGISSLTVNPASLPAGTQGTAYSQTVTATGGTGPYTFAVSAGALPTGLALNTSSGAITGTPTAGGNFNFTIQATDSLGNIGNRSYAVNIGTSSLTVNPSSLPAGTQSTAYSQIVSATGGTGPYTFAVSAGALPTGLTLNAGSGLISGTPTTGGSFNFTVQATDTLGNVGTRVYAVNIGTGVLTVNPATLPNGTQSVAYSQTVSATGGTGPYTFTVSAGSLPAGLTLNAGSGLISGTPTAGGAASFSIQATDTLGNVGTRAYAFNIGTASLTVNPASLPNGTQSTAYSQTVSATGGTGPYTFAVSAGTLPAGLTLNSSSGLISGTPTAAGVANFTIQATDANANTGSRAYALTINLPPLTINPSSLPNATQGVAYSQTVTASGGTGPYGYTVLSGSLPTGLVLNSVTGAITGTPTVGGAFNFTIQATDAVSTTGTRGYSINVGTGSLAVNPASLPNGTQSTAYSQTVSATGGTGPYTFAVSAGALPTGLTLNTSSGLISGTPTGSGPSTFTIRATDTLANFGTMAYTVTIGTASLTVNPASLPNGTQSTAYSQTVSATGGTGPYTFAVSAGTLPTGLTLNTSSGLISGTPSAGGAFNFTIQTTDTLGNVGTRAYAVNIGTGVLTVNPASLPNGTQSVAYSQTASATGGTGPYTFAVSAGSLPTGLTLNTSSGLISGTPTGSGASSFTIRATDSLGNTGTRAYTVTIGTSSLTVNPASLPNGTQSTAYSQTASATGGTGPYTFALISGALPTGLTLNASSGLISGTPSAGGAFNFTVQATDTLGNVGTRAYAVSIGIASLTVNPASLPNGTQSVAYSQTASATGGTGPYTFALSSGALPAGLTLNAASGLISGTPTGNGASNFTIRATDTLGNVGTRGYTVTIGTASLTVNPASLPAGTQGTAYSQTVTATGGTGPYTFALISGTLPAGLTLNASSGLISGTPTGSGSSSFSIRATDAGANIGTRAYTVSIGTTSLTVGPSALPAMVLGQPYSTTVIPTGGTAPYLFSIVAGALPPGLTLNTATGVISGTPTSAAAAAFTVQVLDVNGNVGSQAYALAGRSDPAFDPEVRGLVNAQAETAKRFATAQVDNVMRHLEGLHHRFDPCSFNMGIALPGDEPQPLSKMPQPYYRAPDPASKSYNAPANQVARRMPDSRNCADTIGAMAFWVGGAVQFGSTTPNGLTTNRFTTSGLTAGVDMRVAENLIFGASIGYGTDSTDVGANGTRNDARSYTGTLYASFKPVDRWFLDTAIGYGTLGYDSRRFVTADGNTATGGRDGSYWFGSVALSVEFKYAALKFAPYVRGDYVSVSLKAFAEDGAGPQSLTFGATKFNSVSAAIGLRGSYDIPINADAVLSPMVRVEYRRSIEGAFDQWMYYSDLGPGTSSALSQASTSHGTLSTAIGVRVRATNGLTVDLEYGTTLMSSALQVQTIRGIVRVPF